MHIHQALIISWLDPNKYLFQKTLQETRHLSTHADLALLVPLVQLLEAVTDLSHQPSHVLVTVLSSPPLFKKPLWIFQRLCRLLFVLDAEVVCAARQGCFESRHHDAVEGCDLGGGAR
jgi:hypothetical protein